MTNCACTDSLWQATGYSAVYKYFKHKNNNLLGIERHYNSSEVKGLG
jgi:hypothetical protein